VAKRRRRRVSAVEIWSGLNPPMKRADFMIGTEFLSAAGRWRCTDVGNRTVIAIRLDRDDDPSWYAGPPYAATEVVFDEYDMQECEPAPPRRSYDASGAPGFRPAAKSTRVKRGASRKGRAVKRKSSPAPGAGGAATRKSAKRR
jgi:hypothetical protein